MRVSVGSIANLAAREEGGILVFVAMLTPVLLLFIALSVDIGNWWVHKRHLQLQVDAAALAGGALLGDCFTDPAGANVAITNEATRFGGAAGSSYNEQLGGTQKGTVSLAYQSNTYPSGAADPVGDTETAPPCDTAHLMLDVKASEVVFLSCSARSSSSSLRARRSPIRRSTPTPASS